MVIVYIFLEPVSKTNRYFWGSSFLGLFVSVCFYPSYWTWRHCYWVHLLEVGIITSLIILSGLVGVTCSGGEGSQIFEVS